MARIAPLEPPYTPEIQAQFDAIMKGAPPLLLFRTVAASERAWRKFRGASLLDGRLLTLRQREIVIDRVCARTGCEYEWGVHVTAFARAAGLGGEEIAATVDAPHDAPCWAPDEQALLAAVDALDGQARLPQAVYERLTTYFSSEQVLEVMLLAGFYRTVSYLANGLELPLEAGAARFPPKPA